MSTPSYDMTNVFARILRGDLPCKTVYENEHVLAFHDIAPQAPIHVLVIPKGHYVDVVDFTARASAAEIAGFWKTIPAITGLLGIDADGFRMIANTGLHGGQDVPHFHIHILGGETMGPMIAQPNKK